MDLSKLEKEIRPILAENQLELFSLKMKKEFGETILEVIIDGVNVDSDLLSSVTKSISEVLTDAIFNPDYAIEVSTPGAERPLRNLDEVKGATGKYVHIETKVLSSDGYLLEVVDDALLFQINLKGRLKKVSIPYETIVSIRLAIKF